ncbi:MAG TPA: PAC2 family protein [Candidatus Omnitrophota bacterium]|nr:PAC2 family protein [Candidatus Omnitrophota bacterium]HPD84468.1 PAC2 family protein [Candidatus Omnitrophota bacterium]HRZ03326.1 PAC2 family protein [Candidatus Omnitrophota bacterium]
MIRVHSTDKPKNPILIAAWPGMGNVALKAANYLRDKLKAKPFAVLKSEKFFSPTEIAISKGIVEIDVLPDGKFYHWKNPSGENDLVIFISELQPSPEDSIPYAEAILDFSIKLKVKTVITFAAMLAPMPYTQFPKVWLGATHKKILASFREAEAKPLHSGQISGLNGLFLGVARKKKIQGACLLGEIPFYAAQIENPRTSLALLNILKKSLGITLDTGDLSLEGKVIEEEIEHLIEHIQGAAPHDEPKRPITSDEVERMKSALAANSRIPDSVKKQIEELFSQARRDISLAVGLKNKLDEWNVYKDYEDRFLELFKKQNVN